jgi:thiol-disulfide isomerase/thioredoxin
VIQNARRAWFALLILALAGIGCSQLSDNNPTGANPKPEVSNTPPGSAESKPAPAPSATPEKKEGPGASAAPAVTPKELTANTPEEEPASAGAVTLEKVKFDEFRQRIANTNAKYTMVDCWATWCGPCKENFPHIVAMNQKYAGKGLVVASLSFDDPADANQISDAERFLKEKNATFANFLLDEPDLGGFEKLNINAIPAVFIYGPDGKEVKRFTLDDPNNQFTYDEVEETVVAMLGGKPLPKKEAAKSSK